MSLFGNYNKPGPGVEKNNGYTETSFSLYFQLIGRKFWNLCILNLIMVLFTLPYIGVSYLLYRFFGSIAFFVNAGFQMHFLVSCIPFMFYGPVLSATFKIARDFVREEPIFLLNEFCSTLKKNIGKPILLSVFSYFFFVALSFALPAYFLTDGIGVYVFFPMCLLAFLVLVFMQFYLYTMAACFDLSVKEMLKNGLLLSVACFFKNLLIFLVGGALLVVSYTLLYLSFSYPIMFGILFILLACFMLAFFVYTAAFVTHPILQKYVVEPFYEANPQMTSASILAKGNGEETQEKEIPEYVYHNGRMVHRSVLESESLFDDTRKIGPEHKDN